MEPPEVNLPRPNPEWEGWEFGPVMPILPVPADVEDNDGSCPCGREKK